MPTLFPPLDCMEDNNLLRDGSLLSPDLRASFDTLKSIIHAQRRLRHNVDNEINSAVENNTIVSKKRKVSSTSDLTESIDGGELSYDELEDCKIKVALATALTAEEEISRLQSGIAELESLLLQEGDGDSSVDVPFPSLPYIIPDLDEETHLDESVKVTHRSNGPYCRASEEVDVGEARSRHPY